MAPFTVSADPVVVEAYPRMAARVRFMRAGDRLISTGMDTAIKLWQTREPSCRSWHEIGRFEGHQNAVTAALLSADESRLYT